MGGSPHYPYPYILLFYTGLVYAICIKKLTLVADVECAVVKLRCKVNSTERYIIYIDLYFIDLFYYYCIVFRVIVCFFVDKIERFIINIILHIYMYDKI